MPRYQAAILDLDGVVTQTARLHARAWKETFDAFLDQRDERAGEDHAPFDVAKDYEAYVDGKPRYDGVWSFLEARGIDLPNGEPDDGPGWDSVFALGKRKNERFQALLDSEGVEVYDDAVAQIEAWRDQGVPVALVTSSRNGRRILDRAGLRDWVDVVIDGLESDELGLAGKPAPDLFEEAARRLEVGPELAVVFEDARAGVEAGCRGGFGRVVGVARVEGEAEALRAAGADVVVRSLDEVTAFASDSDEASIVMPRSALGYLDAITEALDGRRLALFTDYDGTLTPIVDDPDAATLAEPMRDRLRRLADRVTVAVVSGRDLDDVRNRVGLEGLTYAGSHGFDIAGPDVQMQQEDARAALPALDEAEAALRERLADVEGARVERKRFAIAVHYRQVADADVGSVREAAETVGQAHEALRTRGGKKIVELQPDVRWDKGHALRWLLDALDLDPDATAPFYLGDDVTDEDAFRALPPHGVGICVGTPDADTAAAYRLPDVDAVGRFFDILLKRLEARASA